jgi:hypothetical protein
MADIDAYKLPLPMVPAGPVKVRLVTSSCEGKTFEHHERVVSTGDIATWRCSACGTTGDFTEPNERLVALIPQILAIREKMNCDPVILLPSDSPPGLVGQFYLCEVYRVQGIEQPLVALTEKPW